jgi:glycosyltransferase involved in cell wall biosynthesis
MVGEIPDYLTDGKSVYFAEPGSAASLAKAMERALSETENAVIVGAEGRKVAELRFNKDVQSRLLFDFLKNLG